MIETTPDAFQRALDELSAAAAAKFGAAVLPIYGDTPRQTPDHIGTAFALDWNGQKLLLTAAHVIDHNAFSSLYVGAAFDGAPVKLLEMEFLRGDDPYDFAIGRIPSQTLEALDGISFISQSDICNASHEPPGTTYTVIGYPNSRNKKTHATRRRVRAEQVRYSNIAGTDHPLCQERNLSPATHLFINYDPKHSRDAQGQRVNSIQPKGMSGGPVFNIGVLAHPSVLSGQRRPDPCLAGLAIEYHKDHRTMIATRVQPILNAVSQRLLQ